MNYLLTYIDPGTTAILWQLLAGALITMGVVLGIWWTKISTFFKSLWVKIFKKKNQENEVNQKSSTDEEEEL